MIDEKRLIEKIVHKLTSVQTTSHEKDALRWVLFNIAYEDRVGEWIPVSERLPINDGKYLVTTDGTFGIDIIDIARFETDEWCKSAEILAWMPLPEPYKGEC